jgi:hypothetical protein
VDNARRSLKLDDVRSFEYLEFKRGQIRHSREWHMIVEPDSDIVRADQTPIAPCVHCGRLTEDPVRDIYGLPMSDHLFKSDEEREPVCSTCQSEALGRALEEDILSLLEDKLGLAEKHRDGLRLFIETIFTDPQKILQMQDLNNRVRQLEKQTNLLWMVYVSAILALLIALASLVVSVVQ